jgi:multiple sugar transport system permease protein
MRVTLIFVLGAVTLEFLLGILIFLALRIDVKGISIFRSLALVPMVVAPVAVGTIWRILYDPDYGIINYIISLLGFSPQMWLADPRMALFSVMLVDVWEWTPLIILFLLAGYQALPRDYIEAAHVDGASLIQELRYIILPLLSPIIGGILILRLIDAFKTMDTIFIMTWGGPGTATEVASVFIYKIGFRYMDVGKAAATSYILLLMISILLIVWTKYSRRGT